MRFNLNPLNKSVNNLKTVTKEKSRNRQIVSKQYWARLRLAHRCLGLKRKKSNLAFGFSILSSVNAKVAVGGLLATLLTVSVADASNLTRRAARDLSNSVSTAVGDVWSSHGSVNLAGDDDYCGADNVIGRSNITIGITREEEYNRFATNKGFLDMHPYSGSDKQVNWLSAGRTQGGVGYQGAETGGFWNRPSISYGVFSFASGCGAYVTGNYGTGLGVNATVNGGGGQAYGAASLAKGQASFAMGVGSEANAVATVAFGALSTAEKEYDVALGKGATTKDKGATVETDGGSVALGKDSVATAVKATSSTEVAGRTYTFKGVNPSATVSIGDTDNVRTITHVSPGRVTEESTDAVNGSQLYPTIELIEALSPRVEALGPSIASAFSENTTYDKETGKLDVKLVWKGEEKKSAQEIFDVYKPSYTSWSLKVNAQEPTEVKDKQNVNFVSGKNVNVDEDSGAVKFSTAKALEVDSVAINNGGPSLSANMLDMNNKKITNLADGLVSAESKDAVTGSQLFSYSGKVDNIVQDQYKLGDSIAEAFGGNSTYNRNTDEVAASFQVKDKRFNNVQAALAELDKGRYTGWKVKVAQADSGLINSNDTLALAEGRNIKLSQNGKAVTVATSPDLTATKFKINNGPVLSDSGLNLADAKITNLADGAVNNTSKEALNGSQLNSAYNKVNTINNTVNNLGTSFAAGLGSSSTFDTSTGSLSPKLVLGDSTYSDVSTALSNLFLKAYKPWILTYGMPAVRFNVVDNMVLGFYGDGNIIIKFEDDKLVHSLADLVTVKRGLLLKNKVKLNAGGLDVVGMKIGNLADGDVTAASKDAVTVSQLYKVNLTVNQAKAMQPKLGISVASVFGGTSSYDTETGILKPNLTVNLQEYYNLQDALNQVASTQYQPWKLKVDNSAAVPIQSMDKVNIFTIVKGDNIDNGDDGVKVDKLGNVSSVGNKRLFGASRGVTISTVPDWEVNSATIPNDVKISAEGLTMGGKKITSLAEGDIDANSKDAITGSQLLNKTSSFNSTVANLGEEIANSFGPNTTYDADAGKLVTEIDMGSKKYNSIQAALNAVSGSINPWLLQVNGEEATPVEGASTITFAQGKNILLSNEDKQVTVALADDLTAESLSLTSGQSLSSSGLAMAAKKITNLQAGEVSDNSTDAVNGSQLYKLSNSGDSATNKVKELGNSIAQSISKSSSYDENTGEINAEIKVNNNTFNSIEEALEDTSNNLYSGWSLKVDDGKATPVNSGATVTLKSGKNAKLQGQDKSATFALDDNLVVDSIRLTSEQLFSDTGLDLKASKIVDLAPGVVSESSRDAINGAQVQQIVVSASDIFGGDATVNNDGTISGANYKVQAKDFGNLFDALEAVNSNLSELQKEVESKFGKNKYIKVKSTEEGAKASGQDSVAVGPSAKTDGNNSVSIGNGAQAQDDNSLSVGKDAKTEAAVATKELVVDNKTYEVAGANPVGTLSVGNESETRTLTNVAAGRVNQESTDLINGSQLAVLVKDINILPSSSIKYDRDEKGELKSSVTFGVPKAPTKLVNLRNVAAAKDDLDAVNLSQLESKLDEVRSYVAAKVHEGEGSAAAGAGSLAAAAIRHHNKPGEVSLSIASGYWKGTNSMAVGAGYTSATGKVTSNVTGTMGDSNWGFGGGVTFTLN